MYIWTTPLHTTIWAINSFLFVKPKYETFTFLFNKNSLKYNADRVQFNPLCGGGGGGGGYLAQTFLVPT